MAISSRLKNNSFAKNFLVLFSGNTVAQLIAILASPVMTRLYSPEDFGVFSTYSSILIVLLTFSSLCFEKAIPLEVSGSNRLQLIYMSSISILFVAFLNIAVYGLFNVSLFDVFHAPTNAFVQWLLSLGLIFAGIYQVFSYTNIRSKDFRSLTTSKIGQSWGTIGAQISVFKIGEGLIIGDVVGRAISVTMLIRQFFKHNRWQKINFQQMKKLARTYRQFPLFSTFSTMFNSLSLQLIILLLMRFYGSEVAGYYALTQKAIGIPITLIGIALSQVFYSEVANKFSTERRAIYHLYTMLIRKIMIFAVPAIVLLILVAPAIFSLVFGEAWRVSGEFAQLVSGLFLGQLIFMPISQVLYATGHQKTQLAWDVGRCIVVFVGMLGLYQFGFSIETVLLYFGCTMGLSYFVLGFLGWRVLKGE
ncbi:lipopolysaccharide biosynthesis protein [Listeria booriae]|uniref:lipopolysaccharide biosynthesis protein n=1 Tax=Listeria booriae TaxID=1552123 RepID=UPI00289DEB1D|nr:oligosaccharide flippase family protein [Listeria booriae]